MPIDIKEFELAEGDFFRGGSELQADKVLEFLAYNPEKAYSRREIQSALEMNIINLLATLCRLEHKGLVRHKGHYWAITEDIESPADIPDDGPFDASIEGSVE